MHGLGKLYIHNNPIGDEGVAAVADGGAEVGPFDIFVPEHAEPLVGVVLQIDELVRLATLYVEAA